MTFPRRRLPDLDKLISFECAARHNSFTIAARELSLTQSAISRHIRELEIQLNISLFTRSRQRVALSSAGAQFLYSVQDILSRTRRAVEDVSAPASRRVLNISTIPAFGRRWLMNRIQSFAAEHPRIELAIFSDASSEVDPSSLDVSIRCGNVESWTDRRRFLKREQLVLVTARSLVKKYGTQEAAIAKGPIIGHTGYQNAWPEWRKSSNLTSKNISKSFNFNTFDLVINAVERGMGSAIVPDYYVEIANDDLVVLETHRFFSGYDYYALFSNGNQNRQESEIFFKWICDELRETA